MTLPAIFHEIVFDVALKGLEDYKKICYDKNTKSLT